MEPIQRDIRKRNCFEAASQAKPTIRIYAASTTTLLKRIITTGFFIVFRELHDTGLPIGRPCRVKASAFF
jgi:hypothetical protein